jgi:hypothetical protein
MFHEALHEIVARLTKARAQGLVDRFALISGLAVSVWAEPRVTLHERRETCHVRASDGFARGLRPVFDRLKIRCYPRVIVMHILMQMEA